MAMDWELEFEREIGRGRQARAAGNEGMARVCARRAAGVLVREHYGRKGVPLPGGSVLKQLRILSEAGEEPEAVREAAGHFFLRITTEHILPEDVDLLADALWLRAALFSGSSR